MKIQEITLLANRLDNLKNFYNGILELPIINYTENSISFQVGSSILIFEINQDVIHPYYHFAFNITEFKKDLAIEWLRAKGINLNHIDGREDFFSESWNSHSIYFYDSAGNIVEFIARHNLEHQLKNQIADEFTSSDLLNISEIGIPTEKVIELSSFLQEYYGENIYITGNSVFTPIGDEEGLLILSTLDRNWLGSNKKVKTFPIKIFIKNGRKETKQIMDYPYIIHDLCSSRD